MDGVAAKKSLTTRRNLLRQYNFGTEVVGSLGSVLWSSFITALGLDHVVCTDVRKLRETFLWHIINDLKIFRGRHIFPYFPFT